MRAAADDEGVDLSDIAAAVLQQCEMPVGTALALALHITHQLTDCGVHPAPQAISGDKAKDKSQGPLEGLLKKMSYNEDQVGFSV